MNNRISIRYTGMRCDIGTKIETLTKYIKYKHIEYIKIIKYKRIRDKIESDFVYLNWVDFYETDKLRGKI